MSSWAKIVNPVAENLQDIMSEEVAKDLKAKKARRNINTIEPQVQFDIRSESLEDETTKSDGEIAKRLQQQFDREHAENLKKTEEKLNGVSKISVSYSNYRRVPDNFDFECEDSEEEEVEDVKDHENWDRLDPLQKEIRCIPRGYLIKNGKVIAKRDITMNNPEGVEFDLKSCSNILKDVKIWYKTADKEDQIVDIDDATRFLLYNIKRSQLIKKVNKFIYIGQEKLVLHATSGPQYNRYTCDMLEKEWVIKIFKTTISEYNINDHDHCRGRRSRQNIPKSVHPRLEKEMQNLLRLKKAGILCPEVVGHKRHILITSFIGRNEIQAPKLSKAQMTELDYINAYDQIVEQMKALYKKANLIHTKLSEDKILWLDRNCYFFDVRKAVETSHDHAFYLLMCDCENITNFFNRKGVPDVCEANTLFEYITGCDFTNRMAPLNLSVRKTPKKSKKTCATSTLSRT